MAARKKKVEKIEKSEQAEKLEEKIENTEEKLENTEEKSEQVENTEEKTEKKKSKKVTFVKAETPKYKIGSIVFVSKDADADLDGFKLFPQYKKCTYTVEAYEPKSDVYTLRRLNLSLRLNGSFILAPNERAHDSLNRKQF